MAKIKKKKLNLGIQALVLKNYFPDGIVEVKRDRLVWGHTLTPSVLSNSYKVKLIYNKGKHPNVFVEEPKLNLALGCNLLPHVYSTKKQWLCLYYRKTHEWDSTMYLADTIVPWASEWLLHYEYWLSTGEWHGGGIEHGENKKTKNDSGNI